MIENSDMAWIFICYMDTESEAPEQAVDNLQFIGIALSFDSHGKIL